MAHKCALCPAAAAVYCKNDSAYLCEACDRGCHDNPLSARHERVPVEATEPQAEESSAAVVPCFDTAGSLPPLDLLLEGAPRQLGGSGGHTQADMMTSLMNSFEEDPLAAFDFGADLSSLLEPESPGAAAPWAVAPLAGSASGTGLWAVAPPAPLAPVATVAPTSSAASDDLFGGVPSSSSDAVVPVLPLSPGGDAGHDWLHFLPSEPSSPLSPSSRVVTTGGAAFGGLWGAKPAKAGLKLGASVPVQTASGGAPALVPSWVPGAAVKPEPVTTNAAGPAAGRKREGSFLAGAPRATARLAHLASSETLPRTVPVAAMPSPFTSSSPASDPAGAAVVPCGGAEPAAPCAAPGAPAPYHATSGYVDNETRADKLARYRAKKARRRWVKTIRYQTRKDYAEVRPRIKGRFVSPEEYAAYMAQQAAGAGGDEHVVPTIKAR